MHAGSETARFIRTVTLRASKLDVSDEKRLTGYAVVFNSESEDLGGWREIIAPSAVDRTLRSGDNVDALIDHRRETTTILGSTDSGLLGLKKDRHGLHVDITPPDTQVARDVVTTVKAGLVKGMSFAFRLLSPDWVVWEEREDGSIVRTVQDMIFNEVSVVLNPAYSETEIAARARALDLQTFDAWRKPWRPSPEFRLREIRAEHR